MLIYLRESPGGEGMQAGKGAEGERENQLNIEPTAGLLSQP